MREDYSEEGDARMALYCQNMLEIAVELARADPDHGEMELKFVEHFLWIASAMAHLGDDTGMWDDEHGFYYETQARTEPFGALASR